MDTKYYLDLAGLKALIEKIVANDKAEATLRQTITGQEDAYVVPTVGITGTNNLTGATSLSDADVKLSNAINAIGTTVAAGKFRLAAITQGANSEYAGQYKLQIGDGTSWNDLPSNFDSAVINIPKDQFLKDVDYVTEDSTAPDGTQFPALKFTWELDTPDATDAAGVKTTYVAVGDLVRPVTVAGDETTIHVTDSGSNNSHAYSVSAITGSIGTAASGSTTLPASQNDGSKLTTVSNVISGVNSAINNMAFSSASTGGSKVTVNVTQSAGKITGVTVSESDIASAQALSDEVTRATGVEGGLNTRLGTAEGDIDALETRMDTAEGDIDALETRMDTAEGDIDALETQVGSLAATDISYSNSTAGMTGNPATVQAAIDKLDDRLDNIDTLTNPLEDYDAIDITVDTTNHKTHASVNIGDGLKKTTTSGQLNKIEANVANGLEIDSTSKAIQVKAADNTVSVTSNGVATTLKIAKKASANTGFAATYQLVDSQGTAINGSTDIDILKDQFLKSVEYCTERKSGDASSLDPTGGYPALRFEWYVNEDGSDQNDQSTGVNYVSIAALGATGTFGAVDTTTNKGEIASPAAAGLATVGAVTTVVNSVRGALDSSATSSNGNNVNVTVTEENGLISAVSVTDNTKNVIANDVITLANAQSGDANGTQRLAVSVDGTTITKANNALKANTGALVYTAHTSSADATLTGGSDASKVATVGDVADKVEDFVNDRIADELSGYKPVQTAVADSATVTASDTDAVVTAVTQNANGVVTVTKNTVGAMLMTGYSAKANATSSDVQATDSVNGAVKKLENRIDGIESAINSIPTQFVEDYFDAIAKGTTVPADPS